MKQETVLHQVIESSYLSQLSKKQYLKSVDIWVAYAGADPSAWTNYTAQEFYASLLAKGLKTQSANVIMGGISYASRWWAKKEGDPSLHFCQIQMAKNRSRKHRNALEPEDVLKLLNTTVITLSHGLPAEPNGLDLRDRALIIVGLETGMRRMSMTGMRIENIATKPYPNVSVPMKGSGKDLVMVPLTDVANDALMDWVRWLGKHKVRTGPVFRPLHWKVGKKQVRVLEIETLEIMGGERGISGPMIYKIINTRAERAGISVEIHPHLFRHSFVTWRDAMGMPPQQIAAITGHSFNLGELGGYMDRVKLGAVARTTSPTWLIDWCKKARS